MTLAKPLTMALESLHNLTVPQAVVSLATAFVTYQIFTIIHCLYFHPLAAYPGPLLARSTRLWYVYYLTKGRLPHAVKSLHDKYGPTVRVAPDELSYIGEDAFKAIYGYKHGTGGEMPKDPNMYGNTPGGNLSILSAPSPRHGQLRRLLSHGFSEKALRFQEPIIQRYLDLFIRRLRDLSAKGDDIDMLTWYNFFTFDVIGDLGFAEPFGCLEQSKYHPWIDFTFEALVMGTMMRAMDYYPLFKRLAMMMVSQATLNGFQAHVEYVKKKALHRLIQPEGRADLMGKMAAKDSGISREEFIASADTVLLGGSETSAALLSGLTYYLLKHPRVLQKLVHEIRAKFQREEDIDFAGVNSLDYMLACIDEAFRLYPPVPGALLRKTREDDVICGQYVPPNTTVGIYHYAIFRNPDYFVDVDKFIPERWIGTEGRFANDKRGVVQPFSFGPRNCIGRNLAYFEMRLTLARLLFNFDIEPTPAIEGWTDQYIYLIWQKKPLFVKLVPRDVESTPGVVKLASTTT